MASATEVENALTASAIIQKFATKASGRATFATELVNYGSRTETLLKVTSLTICHTENALFTIRMVVALLETWTEVFQRAKATLLGTDLSTLELL